MKKGGLDSGDFQEAESTGCMTSWIQWVGFGLRGSWGEREEGEAMSDGRSISPG